MYSNQIARTFFVAALLFSTACENGRLRARDSGALGGAALGAGLGAIIGHQTGHAGAGVAIGSAVGALSGALIGNDIDNHDDASEETDRKIEQQNRELEENRRIIEELKSRGADVRETSRGVVVNLPDVLFDFNSDTLTGAALDTCHEVAKVVKETQGRHVSIEGHTDSIGTEEYNQKLSERRARSVAHELAADGVPRSEIAVRGLGERQPVASNKTDRGRERNRRVEVIIENR